MMIRIIGLIVILALVMLAALTVKQRLPAIFQFHTGRSGGADVLRREHC